jgi:glyoxylase-like metal-dependent hydrolase (beta-lactamase superfamily II)
MQEATMSNTSECPRSLTAEVHILFSGYVNKTELPALTQLASTVGYVRDGQARVIIDPGMVPDPKNILESLSALGESPASITDVIVSHHHLDHTLHAALFPHARFHDHRAIYQNDSEQRRTAEGYSVSPSICLIETPGHTPQDITTLVGTPNGIVAFTHLWWSASRPIEDPSASDSAALHQNRERVLRLATLIVPGHGEPFTPDALTPR